jgi:hypothetical protein
MTESEVVNEWIRQGIAKGMLKGTRENLLGLLHLKFPGCVPEEVARRINQQDDLSLLRDWVAVAFKIASIEEFIAMLPS